MRATPVSPLDVELVDRLTKPTDRVALLAIQDWTTLIEARRASKFHFLPSAVVFTERQLKNSLRDIDLIFLPRYPADTLGVTNPDMARSLLPMLRSDFKVVGETPTLLAWRRIGSEQRRFDEVDQALAPAVDDALQQPDDGGSGKKKNDGRE